MLLSIMERNGHGSSLWNGFDRLQEELSRSLYSGGSLARNSYNPPVNVYVSKEEVLLVALLSGYEPANIELSIIENKVQIKGAKKQPEIQEGFEVQRQEIVSNDFLRTIELPFKVDADRADAKFKNGILNLAIPKAEVEKAKKISVQIEN